MKCILRLLSILMAVLLPSVGWTAIVNEPKLSAPSIPPRSSAHTLTHVELKQSGGQATVLISGDGRLSYRVRPLGTDRVIVDLLNVSTKLTHAFEFNDRIVRQIRIGQHPNVLRLVIDLRQAAIYSVEEGATTLSIVLATRADTKKSSEMAVLSKPSPDLLGSQAEDRVAGLAVPASMQVQPVRVQPTALESESEPRPRQDTRNRVVDRRVVAQPTTQSATERYVAVFGGASLSQSFTNVHGVGDNASVQLSNLDLARTGIGGLKLGFSPSTAKWLVIETEAFYASPHIKQQNITATGSTLPPLTDSFPGSRVRMATWAINWIVRYPGEWVQPYAGAGLGIFWGRLADPGGTSSADTSPGLNALAGIRVKLGQHLVMFSEYKYNRASFDFSNADFHVLYQAHYVVGGLSWSF